VRDQLAVLEDVLHVGPVAGDDVELGHRNAALGVDALDVHDGVERHERNAQIGGVHSDAVLARPEDRVHPCCAGDRRAARPRRPLVARTYRRVAEVAAARALQEVPADRRHVAQLDRGTRQQRVTDEQHPLGHRRGGGQLLHRRQRPDQQRVIAARDPA
jgi:hypothetical protein